MLHPTRSVRLTLLLTSLAASVFAPAVSKAQSGYLFEQPEASLSVRFGMGGPVARDTLFSFFTDQLTLKRGDFRTAAFAADLNFRVSPRVDLGVGLAYDQSNNKSEFQHWLDQDNNPIQQTTRLRRMPVTVNAKLYPFERGRAIGHHAWVPQKFTPYATAGAGVIFYDLEQNGDWVNYQTLDIFTRTFSDSGNGRTAYAGAGAELWFSPRIGLNLEGRYQWGKARLTGYDFSDFNKIDLSGFQATTGLEFRF